MKKLLTQSERPTAVMCSNDIAAIGMLRTLASKGMAVPGDISVVGFDDIHLTEFVYPPLTTVRMSRKDLAHGAFSPAEGPGGSRRKWGAEKSADADQPHGSRINRAVRVTTNRKARAR